MGKLKHPFIRLFISDELPFEERIFNFVCFIGALATIAALIARIAEHMPHVAIVTVIVMLATICAAFFVSVKHSKSVKTLTAIVVFGMSLVMFPIIYFNNGAEDSGMAAYFTLCIMLGFLLLKGKTRTLSLVLTSAMALMCYRATLFWGFPVLPEAGLDPTQRFIDNIQSIFVTGFFMGFVIVFQNHVYLKEKQKAELLESERAAALEQALTASRAKGDFLSNMSHEMRTPLNAIIGMTAIGKTSQTLEKKDYSFEKIDEASKHLLSVINDILDMAKIEANKLELSNSLFEFENMLKKVVNIISLRIDERRQQFYINIDKDIPRAFIGDDHRLAQVITNLLSNAVKFTPKKGTIRLDAHLLPSERDLCRIQIDVSDTGIGVSEEQKARLFQSFEQADAGTSRKFGGTGLGLSISKRIVELMGGEMWVESELGSGSKFSFTVSLKRPPKEQRRQRPIEAGWGNIRVFVVDDDPLICKFFLDMAENQSFTCAAVASGEEALEMLTKDDEFDVYFFDWKLPGMNGVDLTRRIKADTNNKPVVIIFSSIDWSIIEDDARSAGVDRFLSKPLFRSSIVDIINECIVWEKNPEKNSSGKPCDDFSGYTILLAEDVEINREIVTSLLEPTNLTVECAENGVEALSLFESSPDAYDMIFMDIQMPEMDGYEAARRIRALDKQHAINIPIVAMTANVFSEDIERCMEAGMNAHVGKPLDSEELLATLRKYLLRQGDGCINITE